MFRNLTGGDLAESTINRVWDKARKAALSDEENASPLARRPCDLRHACVSTWLAAGVPSTQCAEWAGHSVAALHQVYAKVIAGLESAAHDRTTQQWPLSRFCLVRGRFLQVLASAPGEAPLKTPRAFQASELRICGVVEFGMVRRRGGGA